MDEAALARVEQQRLDLEASITGIKKALRHWQALDIDYQGLSEEFTGRPENTSEDECLQIAQDYGADVVNEKELRELIHNDKGVPRKPEQIIELLSKRIEYVNRNVETIKKRLSDAERKRNALLLAEQPEHREDAGLPLTEITEELDEEGRVLSSKVQRSDEAAQPLMNVLSKAGVRGLRDEDGKVVAQEDTKVKANQSTQAGSARMTSNPEIVEDSIDKKEQAITDNVSASSFDQHPEFPAPTVLNKNAEVLGDSAEDAALRAEMLQYRKGLGEVGAIVAELDLEDGDVSMEDEDDDFPFDSDYDEDEDLEEESEDENGMSRTSLHSEAYLRKMKQLEKRHGITDMSNLGPKPQLPIEINDQMDRPTAAEAARKAALARAEATARSESSNPDLEDKRNKPAAKKKVAFADTLNIAPEAELGRNPMLTQDGPVILSTKPLKDSIVERPVNESMNVNTMSPAKKVSRFKAARSETPQTPIFPPEGFSSLNVLDESEHHPGPAGKIYEPSIIERPAHPEKTAPAPGGDEYGIDEAMHQREIAADYRKLHNRMIQRQGGFVGEGEQNNWGDLTAPMPVEDDAGKVRKVSRFKAARMK